MIVLCFMSRYYSVVRRPMDLNTIEEKLDSGSYKTVNQLKRDFQLIISNCRQYNGSDNGLYKLFSFFMFMTK